MLLGFVLDRRHLHAQHPRIRVEGHPKLFGSCLSQINNVPLERDFIVRLQSMSSVSWPTGTKRTWNTSSTGASKSSRLTTQVCVTFARNAPRASATSRPSRVKWKAQDTASTAGRFIRTASAAHSAGVAFTVKSRPCGPMRSNDNGR